MQYIVERQMNMEKMLDCIAHTEGAPEKKEEMICCMTSAVGRLEKGRDIVFFCRTLMNLLCCKNAFDLAESKIRTEKIPDSKKRRIIESSAREWKQEFLQLLGGYCDLSEEVCNTFAQYLLYAKSLEETSVDYGELYDILYA